MDGANARKPELLAPVGDMEMALAAVHNGADAIYVGVPGFNARGRSKDFSLDELRELVGFCRLFGVKVFFALNILVFEEELERIAVLLPRLAALGADAWIVQDLGLAALARELCPDQPLHASTQATATSAESVLELERFGFSQVVLAREMWLKEIEATAKALREAGSKTELECFAHGALCVAFSGQCLTSESFGGRSANRGQCAQACRLEYSLVVDGRKADLGERRFLVSPRDLESLDEVDEFRRIGVKTLKIEGRLKSPEYVAAATRAYRDRLDGKETTPEELSALSRTFSRGFFSGWLHGPAHRSLVDGRTSAHVGEFLGTVERKSKGRLFVRFADPGAFVAPGDGLLLAGPKGETAGGRVHEAAPEPGGAWIRPSPDCELGRVAPGWRVFVNDSPATERALRNTWHDREKRRRVGVRFDLAVRPGLPPALAARTADGESAGASGGAPCEAARTPASAEWMREELSRLPEPWRAAEIRIDADPALFLPRPELRRLKQNALAELESLRKRAPERVVLPEEEALARLHCFHICENKNPGGGAEGRPELHVLVRSMEQIEALRGLDLASVSMDFEYGVPREEALEEIRRLGFRAGAATPRVMMPGERKANAALADLAPDLILVRNLGALRLLRGSGIPLVADLSLNVANSIAAERMLDAGFARVVPAADLNGGQLLRMAAAGRVAPDRFEVPLYHWMPAFFMRHCVFASCLTDADRPGECGAPCRRHRVEMVDRTGEGLVLASDPFCRNTAYRARPQSSLRLLPRLLEAGVRGFRFEALRETPEELRARVRLVLDALSGKTAPEKALESLGALDLTGISEGRLFKNDGWKDRKKA